ncbi:MAG TPA: hypothetical protein VMR81_04885 [Patescibacteria group bacterium]|nr:hypothetical protein [Patescibacteria group bacterium]
MDEGAPIFNIVKESEALQAQVQAGTIPAFDPRYFGRVLSDEEHNALITLIMPICDEGGLLDTTGDLQQFAEGYKWMAAAAAYWNAPKGTDQYSYFSWTVRRNANKSDGARYLLNPIKSPIPFEEFITKAIDGAKYAAAYFPSAASGETLSARFTEFVDHIDMASVKSWADVDKLTQSTEHTDYSHPARDKKINGKIIVRAKEIVTDLQAATAGEAEMLPAAGAMVDRVKLAQKIDEMIPDHIYSGLVAEQKRVAGELMERHIGDVIREHPENKDLQGVLLALNAMFFKKPSGGGYSGPIEYHGIGFTDFARTVGISAADVQALWVELLFKGEISEDALFVVCNELWSRETDDLFEVKVGEHEIRVTEENLFDTKRVFLRKHSVEITKSWIDLIEARWNALSKSDQEALQRSKSFWGGAGSMFNDVMYEDLDKRLSRRMASLKKQMLPDKRNL